MQNDDCGLSVELTELPKSFRFVKDLKLPTPQTLQLLMNFHFVSSTHRLDKLFIFSQPVELVFREFSTFLFSSSWTCRRFFNENEIETRIGFVYGEEEEIETL